MLHCCTERSTSCAPRTADDVPREVSIRETAEHQALRAESCSERSLADAFDGTSLSRWLPATALLTRYKSTESTFPERRETHSFRRRAFDPIGGQHGSFRATGQPAAPVTALEILGCTNKSRLACNKSISLRKLPSWTAHKTKKLFRDWQCSAWQFWFHTSPKTWPHRAGRCDARLIVTHPR